MRSRLLAGVTVVLMVTVAGGSSARIVKAGEPSRFAALAARQDLRDEVCTAMADGYLGPLERHIILTDAEQILKPEEYEAFKASVDRLLPLKPIAMKRLPKVACKRPPPTKQPKAMSLAHSAAGPVVPASALLPDRAAVAVDLR
jgi:hypothetical protein